MAKDRYHPERDPNGRQIPSGLFREGQSSPEQGTGRPGTPGFPTVEALKALNKRIHEDAGTPEFYKLDQPAPLRSCLAAAEAAYAPQDGAENIVKVAALLAHGIAQAQAFRDGNRRTAYITAQAFLEANGLAYISSLDKNDDMLARRLNQIVVAQSRMKTPIDVSAVERIFRRRLKRGPQ